MNSLYYENQGGASPAGVIITLIVGIIAAFVLGLAYAAGVWFGPLVYLNILFAFIFGLLLAWALGRVAMRTHIRSKGVLIIIALVVVIIALYVQWAAYLTLFNHASGSTSIGSGRSSFDLVSTSFNMMTFYYLLKNPVEMYQIMQYIALDGFWTIDKFTPTGLALWGIWGLEALVIAITMLANVGKHIDKPYSTSNNCWMSEQKLPGVLPYIEDPQILVSQLEQHNFDGILLAPMQPDDKQSSRARLALFSCDNDETAYLSITNLQVKKKKTKEQKVVKFLRLDRSMAARISQHLGATPA